MAMICQFCEKTYQRGNKVPRGIADRVIRRTTKRFVPNIRNKKLEINGRNVRVQICSSCLKRLKKDQRDLEATIASVQETKA
jgi:ribosomal protein L28